MPATAPDTDVLIVGAGPVGLFLANECARRGLRWRLIEARPSQSEHSKALAIFPRTLEIFDMAGIVAPFLEAANRVTKVAIASKGRTLARIPFAPQNSPYRFVAMVPQDVTEKLLAEELRRKGGSVEYETSFAGATTRGDHVSVTLDRKGQRLETTAAYVAGCDGAHSAVRHLLNLSFEGAQYEALFLLADVATNEALPAGEMQLCPSALGPAAIFPMSATRRRIVAAVDEPEDEVPSLDLVRRILAERAPRGIEATALHWSSYFRIHHRQVANLRVGRIFVAGDAAHIHSPFGGQGMNTGLQDAWNLAWKLDLVVNGRADARLLDTYSAERRPVIQGVIRTTHLLTEAMGTASRVAQALRDTLIPIVTRLPPFRHAFVQRLSQLGVTYHGSPIVEGRGERYLDDSMRGGKGVRNRFLLLMGGDAEPSTAEAARTLAASLPDVLELRSVPRRGLTLVRPDGYVAFSSRRRADTAALDSARKLLDRQLERGSRQETNSFAPAPRA